MPNQAWRRKAAFAVACAAIAALHVALTFYFEPARVVFGDDPVAGADFDTHFGQASRFVDAVQRFGRTWSYDVSLLAGHPAGVLFDVDNKGWQAWTLLGVKLGVSRGLAFNLFIVATYLFAPLVACVAAAQLGLSRAACVLAGWITSLVWFFDSQTRYCCWIGMNAFVFGSVLALLPLALLPRYLATGTRGRALATALSLALCLLVHPYAFVVLVVPLGTMVARSWPRLARRRRLGVLLIAGTALALNLWWLLPALRFWHYLLDSAYYSQARLSALLLDFVDVVDDPAETAAFMRTGFRLLVLGAAAITLALWRRANDDRFWPFALGVGWLIAITYLGSYVKLTGQIQPYRFIVPATLLCVPLAAALPAELARRRLLERTPRLALAVGGVAAVLILKLLARDVVACLPDLLPVGAGPPGASRDLRHAALTSPDGGVARWLAAHAAGEGRVLVEPAVLGERLAAQSPGLEVLGGIRERNLEHSDANLFRRFRDRSASEQQLARYLETYAVRWVVLAAGSPRPTHWDALLEYRARLSDGAIAEVRRPTGYLLEGPGQVRAAMNRLSVMGSDAGRDVVLRYHWLETLVCVPTCELRREPVDGDRVGFLRIPAPHPPEFTIENRY